MPRYKYKDEAARQSIINSLVTQQGKFIVEEHNHGDGNYLVIVDTIPEDDAEEYRKLPLAKLTPTQVDAYIDTNVTDLVSAKAVLKMMAKAMIRIAKKSGI